MAAIKSLTEDEKALVKILQSNVDISEFLWKGKDGITPYRVYDYQYAFNDTDGQNIFADARSVGKSEYLARKSCSFIFRRLGSDKLVTAPQMVHLKPVLENIIARIYSSRLLKEMVKGHPSRQPDYLIRLQTGGNIRGRIPGITGIGVKGLHVFELDVDESQDYPESGWENLRECLDMGGQFTIFGVHNGIRNTFYHLSNDSDWKAKIITKMHMLDWGEKERESRIRFYGSSKAPAYIRNVFAICFQPGTTIFTKKGIKRIENVLIGDEVLTHRGCFKRVIEVQDSHFDGELVGLQSYGDYEKIWSTPNHPWATCLGDELFWQEADSITKDDRLVAPNMRDSCGLDFVSFKSEASGKIKKLPEKIPITKGLLSLIGYYLAEGHVIYREVPQSKRAGYTVNWSFHQNEKMFHKEVMDFISKEFGFRTKLHQNKRDLGCTIYCCSKELSRFFLQFGKGSASKKLPSEWMDLSKAQIRHLIRAYWNGDGHKGKNFFSAGTVSKNLAYQVHFLLTRLGIWSHIRFRDNKITRIRGKVYAQKPFYSIDVYGRSASRFAKEIYGETIDLKREMWNVYQDDDYAYLNIRSIDKKKYSGCVYNLTVEDDHSYHVGLKTVHNCGDAEYPMFRFSKFMAGVDQGKKQKDGTYNKFQPTWSSDYYFVRLIAEELGPHHISHYLRFPQLHKKYKVCWLGIDWGHNVDPGEFLIFAEAEVNGRRVLKLIARIHTERLKDTDGNQSQKEIVKEIFSFYNLVGIAADSTGRGGGICQTLMSEKDIKTIFDGFAFNGSLVIGKDEKTKKDIKEPFKRYSGELLQLMVENGEIALPYDDEIVSDWLAHKERPTKAGKEFTADKSADDHTLDAARVAVTQREARRLRHRRKSSEHIPFGRWVGQTGRGSVPGGVC